MLDEYSYMITEEAYLNIKNSEAVAIGVFSEDDSTDSKAPLGILAYSYAPYQLEETQEILVQSIFVEEKERQKGVGTFLINELEKETRKKRGG